MLYTISERAYCEMFGFSVWLFVETILTRWLAVDTAVYARRKHAAAIWQVLMSYNTIN